MKYPQLEDTPIREIIFTITHDDIVAEGCFEKFIALDSINESFKEILPSRLQEFIVNHRGEAEANTLNSGYRLNGKSEVLNIRLGSFSYHYIAGYKNFVDIQSTLSNYWNELIKVVKDPIKITSVSVRYINEFPTDDDYRESRIIQVYPKYSSDRKIQAFQNIVSFSYEDQENYDVMIVSTMPSNKSVLLDITVTNAFDPKDEPKPSLDDSFKPLQEIKNRAFFDSITAKALLRYLKK